MQNHEFSMLKIKNMNIKTINQEHYIKIMRIKNIMKLKSQKDQDHQIETKRMKTMNENHEIYINRIETINQDH